MEEQRTHQNGNDALEFLLYQITDDLVVEILDGLPLRSKGKEGIIMGSWCLSGTSLGFLWGLGRWHAYTHRDALCLILLLFRLEGQFDEELLQLLVAVIDAELLEAVKKARETTGAQGGHRTRDKGKVGKGPEQLWEETLIRTQGGRGTTDGNDRGRGTEEREWDRETRGETGQRRGH